MHILKTKKALKTELNKISDNQSLGLVPTMGALHQGHLALVKKAVDKNEVVVVTIFVNPTQFNNADDLKKYPNTLDADVKLLATVSEKLLVFAPTVDEIYANNITSKTYNFSGLEKVMEGEFRDGHFNGVGTIVEALLRLIAPTNAYFGEKDYQQLQIIKKLVLIEKIPANIIGCPIVREKNGLALSSRNARLSDQMRNEAAFIYKTLNKAKDRFKKESATKVKKWVTNQFKKHAEFDLEYIEISNADTLLPVIKKQKHRKYRAFIAVYAEGVRLIDNIALN